MPFVWDEDISPGAPANAAGMDEIQDNLDIIYAALGITRNGCASGAGWTEFPLVGGLVDPKLNPQPQQLRDATDYAYDNKCPAHDTGVQTGYENADKDGEDTSYYPGYDSTYRTSQDDDENTGYNNGDLVGVDSTYRFENWFTHFTGYELGDLVGVDSSNYPGYRNNENTGYRDGEQVGVDTGHFPGVLASEDGSVYPTYNIVAKSDN